MPKQVLTKTTHECDLLRLKSVKAEWTQIHTRIYMTQPKQSSKEMHAWSFIMQQNCYTYKQMCQVKDWVHGINCGKILCNTWPQPTAFANKSLSRAGKIWQQTTQGHWNSTWVGKFPPLLLCQRIKCIIMDHKQLVAIFMLHYAAVSLWMFLSSLIILHLGFLICVLNNIALHNTTANLQFPLVPKSIGLITMNNVYYLQWYYFIINTCIQ